MVCLNKRGVILQAPASPWLRMGVLPRIAPAILFHHSRSHVTRAADPLAGALQPGVGARRPGRAHSFSNLPTPQKWYNSEGGDTGRGWKHRPGYVLWAASAMGAVYLGKLNRQGDGAVLVLDGETKVVSIDDEVCNFDGNDQAHPFFSWGLFWRIQFAARRILQLLGIFAPLVGATVVMLLPGMQQRPGWRAWYLALLVSCVERSGCCFQKLGQWASMRPDFFAPDLVEALACIRNDVPQHEMAHTRAQIQAALGRELEEVFCVFDPEPCASGSVAQVHRAILRDSFLEERGLAGLPVREVAVKVVHPGVLDTTFVDLEILFRSFASINNVVVALGGPDIQIPFDRVEADRAMRHQLDLRWEARNLARFSQNFAEDDGVVFPEVVLAASGVLVESWLEGETLDGLLARVQGADFTEIHSESDAELATSEVSREKRTALAHRIFDMTAKMYLRDNHVHGDLHAGNLLYSRAPNDHRVFVLDAGLTTALEQDSTSPFGMLLHALSTGNSEGATAQLLHLNTSKRPVDCARLHHEVADAIAAGKRSNSKAVNNMGAVVGSVLLAAQRAGVSLRGDVALSITTMSVSEGLIRQLDPSFDYAATALPYLIRYRATARTARPSGQGSRSWKVAGMQVAGAAA